MSMKNMRGGHFAPSKEAVPVKRSMALVVSAAALVLGVVGGTLAYIVADTAPVRNVFEPGKVETTLVEEFDGTEKTSIAVFNNNSDVPVYVRATFFVTWMNEAGFTTLFYGREPTVGTDYSVEFAADSGWVYCTEDGYYYYTEPVQPNESTNSLVDSLKSLGTKVPDGFYLTVDVVSESVQAVPTQAVRETWGVTVASDGTISK